MHRRTSSSSTVRIANDEIQQEETLNLLGVQAGLWIHDEPISTEDVLINPSVLTGSGIVEGSLIEIALRVEETQVHDFARSANDSVETGSESVSDFDLDDPSNTQTKCLCVARLASAELMEKLPGLEVSVSRSLANAFNFRTRTQVSLTKTEFDKWTASHVELSFRDAYLARSDMWRMVSKDVVGKTLYKGQKLSFYGSLKVTVKAIHVRGRHMNTGYFSKATIPIFRSEAARFVVFIQMSREMWDFDSEGNGEIMFNKVINGFLPDLFRRWVDLEVRHMVSIIMFGRLEYDRHDFGDPHSTTGTLSQVSATTNVPETFHQDFYRVVVTDMASAQWTTILNELKKDFQVFLRDMNLHAPDLPIESMAQKAFPPRITGRPSPALKGNILEAVNIASSQFASDYIDRDLIRTGISTVIVTAGTGVFDVDRDLLKLTSENLTNNGIGIDIVCLSKMPLHSVPLFRYKLPQPGTASRESSSVSESPHGPLANTGQPSLSSLGQSPVYSSFTSTSANYFSRFPSAFPSKLTQHYGYGIPQWIDLSYWSSEPRRPVFKSRNYRQGLTEKRSSHRAFVPRVRMYELQMMGIMELGMADISISYLNEHAGRQLRKRRRVRSDLSQQTQTRSLSQSPTFSRKDRSVALRQKESQGVLSTRAKTSAAVFDKMDKYDDAVYRSLLKPVPGLLMKQKRQALTDLISAPANIRPESIRSDHRQSATPSMLSSGSLTAVAEVVKVLPATPPSKQKDAPRISRSISYALRGLLPPVRTAASPQIRVENIKAQPSLAKTSLAQAVGSAPFKAGRAESYRSSDAERDSLHNADSDRRSVLSSETLIEKPSKPISIGGTGSNASNKKRSGHSHGLARMVKYGDSRVTESKSTSLAHSSSSSSGDDPIGSIQSLDLMPDSVPRSTMPFIRNVNASNPLKKRSDAASAFGRWQHLYPRKPRSSTVKWRSLCTPASVPLTTEDFPSAKELAAEYETREHSVSLHYLNEMLQDPMGIDTLLQEMVALRLAHGYQVVTGEGVARAIGRGLCDHEAFLDAWRLSERGHLIYMTMGSTIQRLSFTGSEQVDVTKYIRKAPQVDYPIMQTYHYTPNIRTMLSKEFKPRPVYLKGFSEAYPWELADAYLAAGGAGQDEKVHELRFWRARFVLLPVDPPANAYRPQQHSDDNEEEIHLLGIRALTQMWQKARYFPEGERKVTQGRLGTVRRRDQNPLEIKFETLNPSEVVATELDKLLALEGLGEVHSTRLLPDSEKLDRETSMSKLAQAMQGEKGIDIKNRRWHLRLHYNCFHGEEFTTWLLHNVRNVETREEAVDFGKELMREGLFEHVNGRHHFKDGNYFYSLKSEFRTPKLDLKGSWFAPGRRSEKSVPPTPLSDHPSRDFPPLTTRSRSGSSLAFQLNPSTPSELSKPFMEKRRKTVCLSKMIKIDVDPRRKSARKEIINLHYDRLHNPENCYHIEVNWLNVTCKLVDDAIVSWTSQAEKYGLKLVEIPIAEASEIPKTEPFRAVYRIKLAVEPPKRLVFNSVFTTNSFLPQQNATPDAHVHVKAILKRFNFVLDLEAVSEFPENVEIEYSWGRLSYRYTQFVHRSGILLAQITAEGDIVLLANRLYNARFANSKDATMRHDFKRDTTSSFRPSLPPAPPPSQAHIPTQGVTSAQQLSHASVPSMSASGIIAPNVQSPALAPFSPQTSADVLPGSRSGLPSTYSTAFVTPEQIKNDLEAFCHDVNRLEQFYREVQAHVPMEREGSNGRATDRSAVRKGTGGSSSSSLLRPIREPTGGVADVDLTDAEVLDFRLPESVTSAFGSLSGSISGSASGHGNSHHGHSQGLGSPISGASKADPVPSSGVSTGLSSLGIGMLRRARGSVMYDSVAEMFGKDKDKDKDKPKDSDPGREHEGSVGGGSRRDSERGHPRSSVSSINTVHTSNVCAGTGNGNGNGDNMVSTSNTAATTRRERNITPTTQASVALPSQTQLQSQSQSQTQSRSPRQPQNTSNKDAEVVALKIPSSSSSSSLPLSASSTKQHEKDHPDPNTG